MFDFLSTASSQSKSTAREGPFAPVLLATWVFLSPSGFLLVACDQPQDSATTAQPAALSAPSSTLPAQIASKPTAAPTVLDGIIERETLRVITRNAPSSYFLGRAGPEGPDADMVAAFAAHLSVSVEFLVYEDIPEMLQALREGKADLIAAGMARTEIREQEFRFGPGYQHVSQQVVCRRDGATPRNVDDLLGLTLVVGEGTSYDEKLQELAQLLPELTWARVSDTSTEDLLRDVWEGHIDCTVSDSNIVAMNRRFFPELQIMFDLTEAEELAWVLPAQAEGLQEAVEEWFEDYWASGGVTQLMSRYYDHSQTFDYVDSHRFLRRARSRLPHFRPLFEQAAEAYGLDWTLLAALSYQESHWDANARSETGVRGLMMLTRATASDLKVKDRTDPEQAILAGAQYLASLVSRIPEDVREPDRTWMALAAYNMGMGHLHDARRLADGLGGDPNVWEEIRDTLPLLSKRRYYRDLPSGYARGNEAKAYVDRVRHYQEMLKTLVGMP